MRKGNEALTGTPILSPAKALFLSLLFIVVGPAAAHAQGGDSVSRLLEKVNSAQSLSTACVSSSCPDADREAMQKLLNDLQDAQFFARLEAFWLSQLPSFQSSAALQDRVRNLRGLHNAIRNLIYDESDDKPSLMRCVVKLNEATGENLSRALIDFDRNSGKERLPQWVWESVQMFGNSLSLDSTESPEKAGEAVKVLDPLIPELAAGDGLPEIRDFPSKIEVAHDRVEQNGTIEVKYELSPCLRNPRFVIVRKGTSAEGDFNPSASVSFRDPSDENPGTTFIGAPRAAGDYEVRVLDREKGMLIGEFAPVTVLGFRVTRFPGIYTIRRSTDNSEIGSHFAVVMDERGNHFWGIVAQDPTSGKWNFRRQRFEGDTGDGKFVAPAELSGPNLRILRSFGYCKADGKGIPTKTELAFGTDQKTVIARYQTWDCATGDPVIKDGEWAFEFEADKISDEPPVPPKD